MCREAKNLAKYDIESPRNYIESDRNDIVFT